MKITGTYIIEEGTRVTDIKCRSIGYPEPTFKWQTNGNEVNANSVLAFHYNLTRDDGGPYECIVSNQYGTSKSTIDIKISCKYLM